VPLPPLPHRSTAIVTCVGARVLSTETPCCLVLCVGNPTHCTDPSQPWTVQQGRHARIATSYIHVPFVLRLPATWLRRNAHRVAVVRDNLQAWSQEIVSTTDILPTLLDAMCGTCVHVRHAYRTCWLGLLRRFGLLIVLLLFFICARHCFGTGKLQGAHRCCLHPHRCSRSPPPPPPPPPPRHVLHSWR